MPTHSLIGFIQHIRTTESMRERTDGQLLDAFIRRREEEAIKTLVQRHGSMVWAVCCRVLGNRHDAEDSFQATFLVLVRRASSIVPREMVGNWLYGVAHQTALKARAMTAKRKAREKQLAIIPEPVAVQSNDWPDLQPVLDEELSRLPDKYRVVIVLCDLEGKTRKEAAQQLGWQEGTVAGRLARARARLAKRLRLRGVELSFGALAAVASQEVARASVPAPVVFATLKAMNLVATGQKAATGVISAKVATLTERMVKAILLTRLTKVLIVLLAVSMVGVGGGLIMHGPAAAQQEAAKNPQNGQKTGVVDSPKNDDKATPQRVGGSAKGIKEGAFYGTLEKIDAKERVITVSQLGTLVGGAGTIKNGKVEGGFGIFKNDVRLVNLPVARDAPIIVKDKKGQLADLTPQMKVSLQLEVKGRITVKEITVTGYPGK